MYASGSPPIGASGSKTYIPVSSASNSFTPNSSNEQIIPLDSIPLIFDFLILKFPGNTDPTFDTITF